MKKLKNFYIKPDGISQNSLSFDSLFLDIPKSNISLNPEQWTELFKANHSETFSSEINDLGFRSDEFKKNHKGSHILFLGCSYTWGTGLYLEEVWSKMLYEKIKKEQPTSGFFNLAIPGDSLYSSITNAFKYFKNFGNPDVLFFNIQDIKRFYAYNKENNVFHRSIVSDNKVLELMSYQYYYMLDQYCTANNINLISFTWCLEYDTHPLDTFKSFNYPEIKNISDFILKCKNENPKGKESLIARDGHHMGTAYHKYWLDYAYDKYKNTKDYNEREAL
jgi:hypothetical protein